MPWSRRSSAWCGSQPSRRAWPSLLSVARRVAERKRQRTTRAGFEQVSCLVFLFVSAGFLSECFLCANRALSFFQQDGDVRDGSVVCPHTFRRLGLDSDSVGWDL